MNSERELKTIEKVNKYGTFEFAEFSFDLREKILLRGAEKISIPPKTCDLLAVLLAHSGRLMTKDELFEKVWADAFVEDANLSHHIAALRKALGEDKSGRKFIETVTRRGYRFVAPVREVFEDESIEVSIKERSRTRTIIEEIETETAENAFPQIAATNGFRLNWKIAAPVLAAFVILPILVVWAYSRGFFASEKMPTAPPRLVTVTAFSGEELEPAISPDGKFVAFCGTNTSTSVPRPNEPQVKAHFNIYLKQADGESILQLTDKPGRAITPAWSPDGRYLAYAQKPQDGNVENNFLYIIPAFGGAERKIYEAPDLVGVAWSPDSKTLSFAARKDANTPHNIYTISIETGEVRQLTFSDADDNTSTNFSPDGKHISFRRKKNKSEEIFIVSTADGAERQITRLNAGISGRADWTTDGANLIFGSNLTGVYRLWKISVDGGEPSLVEGVGEPSLDPSISDDGKRLVYTRFDVDYNVWRVPLENNKGDAAWAEKIVSSYRTDRSPSVSPDGGRIAFVSNQNGAARQIWLADADGANQRQMTFLPDGSSIARALWSPDGRRIVFDATAPGGESAIYTLDAESGAVQKIVDSPVDAVAPAFSNDGNSIYFSQITQGVWQIFKIPANGGEAVQITKNGGYEMRESSDGRFLYYNKAGYGSLGLFRLSTDGAEEKILDLYQVDSIGEWTLTDAGIYFLHRAETFEVASKNPRIRFLSFADNQISDVALLMINPLSHPGLSVSPDGSWLYYGINDRTDVDIMLVENFQTAAK